MPCGRGQTGKGGVVGEEDYGIEEGVSYFFILLVGALLYGYQDRGKRVGETERGMIVRLLPYMLHTQKKNSPIHGQTKSRTHSHAGEKEQVRVGAKHNAL